jgi:hypothetical protein
MSKPTIKTCGLLLALAAAGGCSSYAVPGRGADLKAIDLTPAYTDAHSDPSVVAERDRKPTAHFPATIAVVRIQGDHYDGRTVQMYGSGKYSVAVTRDVEKQEQFDKLAAMPMVRQLEPINRLELPEYLNSEKDLRDAAAKLHADMLLIYTFDDTFQDRDDAALATIFTLGIAPTKQLKVTCVVSAVLVDVSNGYVYGAADASQDKTTLADDWGEDAAADAVREEVEAAAFQKLCDNLAKTWGNVVNEYAPAAAKP